LSVCGQASAANRAFKAIGRVRPDLVLVDITLPGKSGLELVRACPQSGCFSGFGFPSCHGGVDLCEGGLRIRLKPGP